MGLKEDELLARLGTLTVKTGRRFPPPASEGLTAAEIKAEKEEREEGGGGGGEEEDEPVSPAARLFHEPDFNCHIVSVMGIGTRIDVDVLKSGLQSTLARHPRFSSIPVLENKEEKAARWVKTKVSIDDHIIIPDLDPVAISTSPDRLVEDYASSLNRSPMDASRPLWECHVLNFPTSRAAAVLVLRIHHSLGDGISLTSLLLACTRKVSDPTSLPTLPASRRPRAARLEPGPLTFLLWLGAFLILAWHTLLDVVLFIATSTFLKDTWTPVKGSAGVARRPKRFVHRIVSLDDIKDIKDAANCTVNDVLIGVTSAALTRYIDRKYRDSGGDNKRKQLQRNIRLRSTLLVNIRPATKLHALSELMEGKLNTGVKWGNWLGYSIIPFSIAKYEDPLEYVRRGKAIADRKKKSLEAIFTYKSGVLIVKCFGMKVAAALCKRMLLNTTFSFSNIVGPADEIGFYGHPIVYLAPSVYGHPHALTVHFQSYMNSMTIVLAVDESVIPDPHLFLDDLVESVKVIKEAIPAKS